MPTISGLIDDPAWLPFEYEAQRDTLTFAHLPREAQRRITFIDIRHVRDVARTAPLALASLPLDRIRAEAQPLHFVFHTAFCCSTLLARALDAPGVSMGVKEPMALAPLGDLWARGLNTETHARALDAVLDLLSRPLAPGEQQVVKPSNAVNMLLPEVLARRPDTKVLLLYSDLDVFLDGTVNKGAPGRDFARYMAGALHPHAPFQLDPGAFAGPNDLRIAASAWLMQVSIFKAVADRFGPARVRTLKDESFLARKADALAQLGELFDLAQPQGGWARIAASEVFSQHAKHPGDAFDDATRRAELDRTRAAHKPEIDAAIAWTQELAARTGAPQTLGDTLFDA